MKTLPTIAPLSIFEYEAVKEGNIELIISMIETRRERNVFLCTERDKYAEAMNVTSIVDYNREMYQMIEKKRETNWLCMKSLMEIRNQLSRN